MNYFPFYHDPVESAHCLDDKRIIRVFAESTYVLSWIQTLTHSLGPYGDNNPRCPKLLQAWILEHPDNTAWYVNWIRALLEECVHRFGVERVRGYLSTQKWKALDPSFKWRPHAMPSAFLNMARAAAKGLDYTHYADVHEAYRGYVAYQWTHVDKRACTWTDRETPEFYAEL